MAKKLDCLTQEGRRWIAHQDHAISVILMAHPSLRASASPNPEDVYDAIFYRKESPVSVSEVKSRKYFAGDIPLTERIIMDGGYLITWEKLQGLRAKGIDVGVPTSLIVNLVTEGKVLVIKMTDVDGNYIPRIHAKRSKTKATCNGGEVERINAWVYPSPENMRVYPYSAPGLVVTPR